MLPDDTSVRRMTGNPKRAAAEAMGSLPLSITGLEISAVQGEHIPYASSYGHLHGNSPLKGGIMVVAALA